MAQVVVVTSGKGGVGKTTSTAALGAALARAGERVVVVDFDVGLRNLDLVMGAERHWACCQASARAIAHGSCRENVNAMLVELLWVPCRSNA